MQQNKNLMYSSWHAIKILLADTKTMVLSKKYICNLYHVKYHYPIKDCSAHLFFLITKEKVDITFKDDKNNHFGRCHYARIWIELLIIILV